MPFARYLQGLSLTGLLVLGSVGAVFVPAETSGKDGIVRIYRGGQGTEVTTGGKACRVRKTPASLRVSSFYGKYCDGGGIPILASSEVANKALVAAWKIVKAMTRNLSPSVRRALQSSNVRIAVIGRKQGTADIPEYAGRAKRDGAEALNRRARGLGGQVASAGEENLICLKKDRYRGESILIHEFAHTIWHYGVRRSEGGEAFQKRLDAAFKNAKEKKRLLNKYAGTNSQEYWAEGVQTYFDSNLPSDIEGRSSRTRKGLIRHDRALFRLIQEIFGRGSVPHCHKKR